MQLVLKRFSGLLFFLGAPLFFLFAGTSHCESLGDILIRLLTIFSSTLIGGGLMFGFKGYKEKISAFSYSKQKEGDVVNINNTWFAFIIGSLIQLFLLNFLPTNVF